MNHGISLWRASAKLDALLRQLGPAGERIIGELDQKYPRR
jgi:hypothetical protein